MLRKLRIRTSAENDTRPTPSKQAPEMSKHRGFTVQLLSKMTLQNAHSTRCVCPLPVLFAGILCLMLAACGPKEPRELAALAEAFREANQAETIEPMLALYALEGTTESTRNLLKTALLFELGLPVESIEFEPLSGAPEESIHYTHQGIEYGPTLTPGYRMHVRYGTEDNFESRFTIGRLDDGTWRILSSRPIETPGDE